MKTVEVLGMGGNARLEIGSRDIPTPSLEQVLIKVHAAGVNRADILQKQGKYPPPKGASDVLGLEVSGQVVEVGEGVKGLKKGDKVCALLDGGGYAEYAIANQACVLPIIDNMSFEQAASLPESLFTAWSNIFTHANMKEGECLLFHGGTSGVGVMALQIAKEFGIKCYATAGSKEKCDFLNNLGVDKAINYKEQNFVEIIKESGGVDVVIDMVGGDYWTKNLKLLKKGGRLISIAMINGAKAEINFVPLLINNLTLKGTTLRSKPIDFKASIQKELVQNIMPKLKDGAIKPIVDSVFDIEDVEKAHNLMLSSQHIGKIVLKIC